MYNLRKSNGEFEVDGKYEDWEKAPRRIKKIGLDKDGRYEVEKILQMRKNEDGSEQYLVKWKNWSSAFNSWEPKENLDSCSELVTAFESERKLSDEMSQHNANRDSVKVFSVSAFSTLEDVLQLLGKKEEFSSRNLDEVYPTCIYGFPVIDGVQGIRLSWEDRLIETVGLKEAISRWPEKIKALYDATPQHYFSHKLDY